MKKQYDEAPSLNIRNLDDVQEDPIIKKYAVNAFTQNEISLRGILTKKEFFNLVTLTAEFIINGDASSKRSCLEVVIEEIMEKGNKANFNFTPAQHEEVDSLIEAILNKGPHFLAKQEIGEYQFKNMKKWLQERSEKSIDADQMTLLF